MESTDSIRDLLACLDLKPNDLMFGLYGARQPLVAMRGRAQSDEVQRGVEETLASLREQDRTLVNIQRRIGAARRASGQP